MTFRSPKEIQAIFPSFHKTPFLSPTGNFQKPAFSPYFPKLAGGKMQKSGGTRTQMFQKIVKNDKIRTFPEFFTLDFPITFFVQKRSFPKNYFYSGFP